jgi:hypothetical protein
VEPTRGSRGTATEDTWWESVSSLLPGGDQAWLAEHERQVLQLATAGASALRELEQSRRERAHQHGVRFLGQIGELVRIPRQVVQLPLAGPYST